MRKQIWVGSRWWMLPAMVGLIAAGASACGDDDDDSTGSDSGTADAGRDSGTPDSGTKDAGETDAGVSLSDSEISAVVIALNTGEIQAGKLAMMRASATSVRNFANRMVTEHTAANDMLTTLLQTLMLAPVGNSVSENVMEMGMAELKELMKVSDSEFDVAYMKSQVEDHMTALMLIDSKLLPEADNPMLRAQLMVLRKAVMAHLDAAQAILDSLEADGGVEDAGTQ
jgi:putative membrane protein